MSSFDIVSQVNTMEIENAANQIRGGLANRFGFKGSQAVKKIFENGNIKEFTVQRIEPTLEDVFVNLIENYDKDNEPPKS